MKAQEQPVEGVALTQIRGALKAGRENIEACEQVIKLLEAQPELDAALCKVFGLRAQPNFK